MDLYLIGKIIPDFHEDTFCTLCHVTSEEQKDNQVTVVYYFFIVLDA